ncbi:hypothetical protein JXD20_01085 [Candidatus Peregrinibacteria bacterium]|nr:hypothetical protein [Candidatus Peregrinibacteria bacterium]
MTNPDISKTLDSTDDAPEVVILPTALLIRHAVFCGNSEGEKREENMRNMSRAWAGFLDARKSEAAKQELWLSMKNTLHTEHGSEPLSPAERARVMDMVRAEVKETFLALRD